MKKWNSLELLIFFLDKNQDTFKYSLNQSSDYLNQAYDELSDWISQFIQDFDNSLEVKYKTLPLFQEYFFFQEHADALENFLESFMAVDLVQFMLSDSSN